MLGTGLEFDSIGTAYLKGPYFGLVTCYLQCFRNCAKPTVVSICTTCSSIENNSFFVQNLSLVILKVRSHYFLMQH